ncbi:hypothetical protein A6R68_17078, partial [Neotoma lepida]
MASTSDSLEFSIILITRKQKPGVATLPSGHTADLSVTQMHPFYTLAATMRGEICAAATFISKFLSTKGLRSEQQLQTFSQSLQELLAEHYKHHWFPEKPCKGSGYRCLRINHKMDPLIGQAAQQIGLSSQELFKLLPCELTLWVDPYEVSYRIGEDGSICVLYEALPAV